MWQCIRSHWTSACGCQNPSKNEADAPSSRTSRKIITNQKIELNRSAACMIFIRTDLLKSGPVFQMLVLPTQPLGGSVMFSFSKSSWIDRATTATASLMCADSFLPLMSWRPISPVCWRQKWSSELFTLDIYEPFPMQNTHRVALWASMGKWLSNQMSNHVLSNFFDR